MSTATKVALVEQAAPEFGLQAALAAVELRPAEGVAKLIAIVGHTTKVSFGWAVGESANTELALAAWARAKRTLRELGVDPAGVIVHHDQDPVFTSYGWTSQLLVADNARLSYALNGARDNTEMESFFSRFKTENHSLLADAQGPGPLGVTVDQRMEYYNRQRRHSTIGYVAPWSYAQALQLGGASFTITTADRVQLLGRTSRTMKIHRWIPDIHGQSLRVKGAKIDLILRYQYVPMPRRDASFAKPASNVASRSKP